MIIRNGATLGATRLHKDCLKILESGLQAADPANFISRHVSRHEISGPSGTTKITGSDVYTVAFGKAADSMTREFCRIVQVSRGIVVIPKGTRSTVRGRRFQVFNTGHPKPDAASVKAAREIIKLLQNRRQGDLVVFLVSGGGSSLVALPKGITLDDKIRATDVLLRSGAPIHEINCVRRHISQIKGGKVLSHLKCQAVGLIMSDVQGDDPATIASGTVCADPSTVADAMDVICRHGMESKMPGSVLEALQENGADRPAPHIQNHVIATNMDCIRAMEKTARHLGYGTSSMQIFGDIKDATKEVLKQLPHRGRKCLIFGGETTTKVLGRGLGGRNQEIVLRLLKNTREAGRMVIASIGTDGIDGNSPYAGAITENSNADLDAIREALRRSNSGGFFQGYDRSIITGPTHTNLMDVGVVVRGQ